MTKVIMGHDRGNERTKVAGIDKDGHLFEMDDSSAVCQGSLQEIRNVESGSDVRLTDSSHNILQYEETTYFVGQLAEDQGENPSTGIGDKRRYTSKHALVSLLTYGARLAWRMNSLATEIDLQVVTGVPYKLYSPELQEEIINSLSGDYDYILNGREMRAHVSILKVMMEGAGAIIALGNNEFGVKTAIVDSGKFTTNILLFENVRDGAGRVTMKPRTQQSTSMEIGMHTAMNRLNSRFLDTYGRELETQELYNIFRAYIGQHPYPPIIGEDSTVPTATLTKWTREAISDTGDERNAIIGATWGAERNNKVAASFHHILHVGGGSYYFHDSLKTIISRAKTIPHAERQNARGYAARAYNLSQSRTIRSA